MLALFEAAIDNGSICDILGCGFDWLVIDARIKTKYEYIQLAQPWYKQVPLYTKW